LESDLSGIEKKERPLAEKKKKLNRLRNFYKDETQVFLDFFNFYNFDSRKIWTKPSKHKNYNDLNSNFLINSFAYDSILKKKIDKGVN